LKPITRCPAAEGQLNPAGEHNSASGGPNLTWHGFLYPYLGINRPGDANKYWWFSHEPIYRCPSKDTEPKGFVWGQVSYGMSWFNSCAGSVNPCSGGGCKQKHYWKANENGAKTVLVADSSSSNYPNNINIFSGNHPSVRHPNSRTNMILWDLHVANLSWVPRLMGWSAAAPRFDRANHFMGSTTSGSGAWYENEYRP